MNEMQSIRNYMPTHSAKKPFITGLFWWKYANRFYGSVFWDIQNAAAATNSEYISDSTHTAAELTLQYAIIHITRQDITHTITWHCSPNTNVSVDFSQMNCWASVYINSRLLHKRTPN